MGGGKHALEACVHVRPPPSAMHRPSVVHSRRNAHCALKAHSQPTRPPTDQRAAQFDHPGGAVGPTGMRTEGASAPLPHGRLLTHADINLNLRGRRAEVRGLRVCRVHTLWGPTLQPPFMREGSPARAQSKHARTPCFAQRRRCLACPAIYHGSH